MTDSSHIKLKTDRIKAEAQRLGFSACGIARCEKVGQNVIDEYCHWLDDGKNANMEYLRNHSDIRFNPQLLLDDCKTIISLALNYYPPKTIDASEYQLAYYAYGKDYHDVMRRKIAQFAETICGVDMHYRICVDTAPILERYWAQQSGIGWIGRNRNLIIPHKGSFFFLGELLIDGHVDKYDAPMASHCGTCRKCLDACPNHALTERGLDSRRCLSYLTIEHRGAFSDSEVNAVRNQPTPYYIYGCDRCQIVCPHNTFAKPCQETEFLPDPDLLSMSSAQWFTLSREQYQKLFKGSAVKRAKYEGLMRNINTIEDR